MVIMSAFPLPPPLQPPHTYRVVNRHAMAPPPQVPGLQVRPVTAANYEAELDGIGFLLARYPYVAIDTEYPGTVHRPPPPWRAGRELSPPDRYELLKANVDELPVVQLGITLCDEYGNLPTLVDGSGRPHEVVWEVTFSDFDARRDRHAPESVAFLRSQGLDFDQAIARGVSSAAFAAKLAAVLPRAGLELTWAAFGGAHDFAYVVKMLSGGRPLPGTWHEFAALARDLLVGRVFDAKYMAEHCERADLCGGLRRVAESLRVQQHDLPERPAWLAGRKSYIASRIFTAMRRRIMYRDGGALYESLIDGLHI
ncbi:hypothetical protein SETIT_8G213500v2 [Setaria italica]|uniref:poly(A)-specific ribonuclease n=2 Tax=Setaria italica TaxID=4555 RepID=A0A368SAE3_SETIT|nr:probable CCR4-associated factor 1 homolog 9 [Setaria italica]RCV39313.1 hypothetical protein SETIT_8G213500v2 [Setaria italica]